MFLLNLGLLEFVGLFGAMSGLVVTLYLLSRSRRKVRVSTLRFWNEALKPISTQQRRRIQQPWSLLLQLLSLLLLLLAVAQLRLGSRETSSRDHVLLLDTSSWMAAHSPNSKRTLLDEAKIKAKQYVRALAYTDRVMLVRADGLPSPATGMESDRAAVEKAIDESRPAAAALNLDGALSFAGQVESLNARTPGEIVFIGAGRLANNGEPAKLPRGLRVIPVSTAGENSGITSIGLRRSPTDGELWEVFVSSKNYGVRAHRIPLILQFGGATIGSKVLSLPAGKSEESTWKFRTKAAGWVEARLLVNDALNEDNRAILEIPALQQVNVAVYTSSPELLRPVLDAHPQVKATYHALSEYRPDVEAQVIMLDRFAPSEMPKKAGVVWIEPPERGTPFHIRSRVNDVKVQRWQAGHELGSGLHSRDFRFRQAEIFSAVAGDIPVAETAAGPVVVARPQSRAVALGFHPGGGETRFDVTTPLLMANILRWFEPGVFRSWELQGGSVGAITVPLDAEVSPKDLKVIGEQQPLPFTVQGRTLRFFAGMPGDVRVISGSREQVHSLSLPEVGDRVWEPPSTAKKGVPAGMSSVLSHDLWQILAALGCLGLLAEWMFFGRKRTTGILPPAAATGEPMEWRKAS